MLKAPGVDFPWPWNMPKLFDPAVQRRLIAWQASRSDLRGKPCKRCHKFCTATVLSASYFPRVKQKVLEELAAAGVDLEAVPDLCEMSARRDPLLKDIAGQPNLKIAACYPRAVRGLFAAAECPLPEPGPEVINMRVLSGDEAAAALLREVRAESTASAKAVTA